MEDPPVARGSFFVVGLGPDIAVEGWITMPEPKKRKLLRIVGIGCVTAVRIAEFRRSK